MKNTSEIPSLLAKQIEELTVERDRLLAEIKELEQVVRKPRGEFVHYAEKIITPFYQLSTDLTKIMYVNSAAEEVWSIDRDALYQDASKWFESIHPDDRSKVREHLLELNAKKTPEKMLEYRIKKRDGSIVYVQDFAVVNEDNEGSGHSIVGFVIDITKYVSIEKTKFIYEQVINAVRYSQSIESGIDAIVKIACNSFEWDEGEVWIFDSPARSFYCISVYHKFAEEIAEFYQLATSLVINADEEFQGYVIQNNKPVFINNLTEFNKSFRKNLIEKFKITTAFGLPILYHDLPIGVLNFFNREKKNYSEKDAEIMVWISGMLAEMIQHNLSNQKLLYITSHNDLTGLLNRNGLESGLQKLITKSEANIHGIIMLDIDRFKLVNEMYDFVVGDILLRQLGLKFREELSDTVEVIANLGGDVFAFVAANLKTAEQIKPIIDKILLCLHKPFLIKNNQINLQASIGVSVYPYDGLDILSLLKSADIALQNAKKRGNTIRFSTKSLQESVSSAIRIENGLRRALVDNQFRLHYQPKIDLRSGAIAGLEALLRWADPQNGLQPPNYFLHIAEQSDLIVYIGEWVLLELAYHFPLMDFKLPVAVNLDARQLNAEYDLHGFIIQLSKKMLIPLELLELEVTEAQIMEDAAHATHTIQKLQHGGMAIAIDDFGSGYSSFAYLRQFKPNRIKIDKSFIDGLPLDKESAAIVKSIIMLCHNLGMKVLAEGVETADQVKFLMHEGCDEAQGFYFSKPLNLYELRTLIEGGGQFTLPK